ncbi:transposable element Tcb2 transposase [Trichonephila clavipes]|nr:transposable element Tcb2 transposase [Trichonephila clavipes]
MTTASEDRYLALNARRNRKATARQLSSELAAATGAVASRQTIYRRLNEKGLYARKPRSRFSLTGDSKRVYIWRESGTRNDPSNIVERDRFGSGGVMVWGGIMIDGRTPLHVFRSVTGQIYRDEVLDPYVRLFRGAYGRDFLFMDDNARPHRANLVDEFLESEDIKRIPWPANSPDLKPIENLWDYLGRAIARRHPPPRDVNGLKTALLEEWSLIPQTVINNVISSLKTRCDMCVRVREIIFHIKFIMFDPSSSANPTPLAHADTSRDVLPRGGTSQWRPTRFNLYDPEMRNARGFNVWPEVYFSASENITEFLEGIDNQIKLLEIPSDLSCAYLKGHLLGRALDWYQIFGSALVQNTATDFAQLKAALSKAFPADQNRKDL